MRLAQSELPFRQVNNYSEAEEMHEVAAPGRGPAPNIYKTTISVIHISVRLLDSIDTSTCSQDLSKTTLVVTGPQYSFLGFFISKTILSSPELIVPSNLARTIAVSGRLYLDGRQSDEHTSNTKCCRP